MVREALVGAFQAQGLGRNMKSWGGGKGGVSHGKAKTRNNNGDFKYLSGHQLQEPVDLVSVV